MFLVGLDNRELSFVTVPWHRINPFRFEELALEYARSEFPQHHWVHTPRTGDGNRDAEAFAHETVLNRVVEYQHWLEAKFHHKAGSPTRSQLDPTLVSGLIAPNVRAILFVTNLNIPTAVRNYNHFVLVRINGSKQLIEEIRKHLGAVVDRDYDRDIHDNSLLSLERLTVSGQAELLEG